MSTYRQLDWWTTEQLEGISSKFQHVVERWMRDWRPVESGVAARARNLQDPATVIPGSWLRHGEDDMPSVWLDGSTWGPETLCQEVFDGAPSSPLMQAIGESACRDFIERVCRRASASSGSMKVHTPGVGPWLGYVDLTFTLAHGAARFLLNAASVASLVNRPATTALASVPAHPVLEAVQLQGLSLDVRLADVELDLVDLQALQVGDVIVLDHGLAQPLFVHSRECDSRLPCDAYLGKIGDCKAVELHRHHSPGDIHEPQARIH